MFEHIKGYDQWIKIEKIEYGWSDDLKYYIETIDNFKMILRTSSINNYELKKKEYEVITMYAKLGFKMSLPLDFGVCNDGHDCYMLLTWVEGKDLETALPNLDEEEQYRLGRVAGKILKQIHSIEVPIYEIPMSTKIEKKLAQINRYVASKVRISNDETAIAYVFDNIHKIWSKPPAYLHGDFHPGNLILTKNHEIGVIDFNRWSIGDPYEEFYKLELFGTMVSIPYAIGQLDAYFDDDIQNDFWDILAVYVAHASLYSIHWAEKYGQNDIDHMTKLCLRSFKHYNDFKTSIPIWYKKRNV